MDHHPPGRKHLAAVKFDTGMFSAFDFHVTFDVLSCLLNSGRVLPSQFADFRDFICLQTPTVVKVRI